MDTLKREVSEIKEQYESKTAILHTAVDDLKAVTKEVEKLKTEIAGF